MNPGDSKSERETRGVLKEKLSCSIVESFFLVSKVGDMGMSMA
jgi:hypothetical protein